MSRFAYVVFSRSIAGRETEYNRWYSERHLSDVLRVPGVLTAQRFKIAEQDIGASAPYLAIYEIESDNVQGTLAEIASRAGSPEMPISPALDVATVTALVYEAITDRKSS